MPSITAHTIVDNKQSLHLYNKAADTLFFLDNNLYMDFWGNTIQHITTLKLVYNP